MSQLFVILFAFFVQFTDKAGSEHIALSELALKKRAERNIAIDSLDYAVSPVYIDSLRKVGCSIYHTSRWMNGATVETTNAIIDQVKQWSFVDTVYLTRTTNATFGKPSVSLRKRIVEDSSIEIFPLDTNQANLQLQQLKLPRLHTAGFHGQGITIAVIDGGFQNADTLAAFDAVREQILGAYDLTDDSDNFYGSTGSHGTKCFSTIAAITSNYTGAATQANYYLIRSEENYTESPKEMDNWVAAIELSDSLGVDITSTSLGYAMFDEKQFTLSYSDMDGQATRSSRTATIASRKGMLVVVAAGNEGDKTWHYITSPADADSILTVGAIDVLTNEIAKFSSWGPTADGRVKPEVCAVGKGTALINPIDNSVVFGNGTSFACPIIAGMAACLWSALPDASNMEIRERIIQSSSLYNTPHDQYGYGIPDVWQAYNNTNSASPHIETKPSAEKILIDGQLWIIHEGYLYNIMGQKKG